MKKILSLFGLLITISSFAQVTTTFTASGTFTVPTGVCNIIVEAWGAGGAGGSAVGTGTPTSYRALGGGGGGGGYSKATISVTPGASISYTVAPSTGANSGTTPLNGGTSTFGSVSAPGGIGGSCENSATAPAGHKSGTGGAGGVGTTTNGGSGGTRTGYAGATTGWTPGGGGGGAGTTTNGGDAPNTQNGTGGTAGTADGGAGGNGPSSGTAGSTGTIVAGGGSGAFAAASTTFRNGGAGARGQIRITYTVISLPVITPATITTLTNTSFSYQIIATNNPTNYTATGLPASLTCDPTTGLITGTPTSADAGTFPVTFTATNCAGTTTVSSSTFTFPVELTKFNVVKENSKNIISWSTASEKNNSHFNVQRSKDASRWENISKVSGSNNSISNINYDYTDIQPLKGISYYRLEQVDFNSKTTFSAIVSINNGSKLEISPIVKANNQVEIKVYNDTEEIGTAQIIDISGKIISTKSINLQNGSNVLEFDLSSSNSGTYVVKVIAESGEHTQKLLILN